MSNNLSYDESTRVEQIASGNTEAFRQLYDEYRDRIFSFSLNLLQREGLAEELVQDVFMKIWAARTSIKEIENIGGFLYTVARNLALTLLKRMAHEQQIIKEMGKAAPANNLTEDEVLHRDYQNLLSKAIQSLPDQQRTVYLLAKEKGLSRQEIAANLNISPNTVKAHLSAATATLRSWFARYKGEMLALFIVLHGHS